RVTLYRVIGAAAPPLRESFDARSHCLFDTQWRVVRPVVIHVVQRFDADFLDDGSAQLRPRQLFHAGCLLRLCAGAARWLLACVITVACSGCRAWRDGGAVWFAPCS